MAHGFSYNRCFLLHSLLQCFILGCLSFHHDHHEGSSDIKILNVSEELEMESLPLRSGQRLYQLDGLKDSFWYEIKISYPASIPASFSIQLKRESSLFRLGNGRKLLNTEKLIFKAEFDELDLGKHYVLVRSEAAGVVAKPGVKDRDTVLFNIVCDELSFGIPHRAWLVGMVAVLCLVLAFMIPSFLPTDFFPKTRSSEMTNPFVTKDS